MDQLINQVLRDRYCVESMLGRKTGRRTFLATDLQTLVPVVIKLLLFGPDFTWDDLKLFEREARTLQSLNHPAISQYIDSFEIDTELGKGFALVQSYIQAPSLQNWVETGRTFSEEELKAIAKQLLSILDYLHCRHPPVIHRDIKPSNILLSDRSGNSPGQVYLIDFGSVQTSVQGGTVTVVGTYGYMPPEQFGGRATPASDLYSVGSTLIYLATGEHPSNLPQKDLRIEFEQLISMSTSFTSWIQWLIEPNLSTRAASAKSALEADFYQHFQPVVSKVAGSSLKKRFSLKSNSPESSIQLKKTTTTLKINVPRSQLHVTSSDSSSSGCSLIFIPLVMLAFSGLWQFFFPTLILALVLSCFQHVDTEPYDVTFKLEGSLIYVDLFSIGSKNLNRSKNLKLSRIFSQERLESLSAGPNLPKYQLNIDFRRRGRRGDGFYITGNRAEIQWLCDELNEWTGLEIEYKNSTSGHP
ncbi:serine/threonine protein kinase [Aetokthonos hydrillicola Thurmond2011]|jgi:serine/threonine protein kinase|uniref:Serine/threonine protein kinase n=1 Tax=Aetokthonos hydrillicola Thurmond2011 TaxID=2712845 RepID=A0AAP5I404_9CYAN|nr:serine/threonine-protein kinase [Aetokthonos hydrillicola]MBO3457664.1 serine/threonine protein kinase [Aetokthonos hydrillicola CCALA 1050]MBW4587943.1 serine/threonine protein kinase [Aetokthonos hydrillicola CCALA 1050]MDR9894652.1 serine/threonine protein kinase [Aetokthonos hydrillicola Thurmond2011]